MLAIAPHALFHQTSRFIAREQFGPSRHSDVAIAESSAKLFDKVASRGQVGEAPAIIYLSFPNKYASMSRPNVMQIVKGKDLAARLNIQPIGCDGQLDDVRVFSLVR